MKKEMLYHYLFPSFHFKLKRRREISLSGYPCAKERRIFLKLAKKYPSFTVSVIAVSLIALRPSLSLSLPFNFSD
jgi:hypothetical protein